MFSFRTIRCSPSSKSILYFHPSRVNLVTSISLRGVPSGLVVSYLIFSGKTNDSLNELRQFFDGSVFPNSDIDKARFRIFNIRKREASARSSTCRNSRRGAPAPPDFYKWGMTRFTLAKFSNQGGDDMSIIQIIIVIGPYKFVGIALINYNQTETDNFRIAWCPLFLQSNRVHWCFPDSQIINILPSGVGGPFSDRCRKIPEIAIFSPDEESSGGSHCFLSLDCHIEILPGTYCSPG